MLEQEVGAAEMHPPPDRFAAEELRSNNNLVQLNPAANRSDTHGSTAPENATRFPTVLRLGEVARKNVDP